MSIPRLITAAFILLLSSQIASAHGTAQLNGRVTDESGGVLPGVTVTATQTDTGAARTTTSDESGAWVMPNLPLGPYRVELSLQGFRTYVQTGIVLQVNANPVINASLALGNLAETVAVDAAAPLVDVRSAGISQVVQQDQIIELPLQGRTVTDLIMLAGSAGNTGRVLANLNRNDGVVISIAGGLRTGVAYSLDGALNSDFYDNTNLSIARVVSFAAQRTLELRIEAFNVTNNFNWGDPNTTLNAGTFGRITTQTGDSRILQFAVKYGF